MRILVLSCECSMTGRISPAFCAWHAWARAVPALPPRPPVASHHMSSQLGDHSILVKSRSVPQLLCRWVMLVFVKPESLSWQKIRKLQISSNAQGEIGEIGINWVNLSMSLEFLNVSGHQIFDFLFLLIQISRTSADRGWEHRAISDKMWKNATL